jgi:hypothetical protein
MKKNSSSQASWSILSEGVSSARVEAHIIRSHVNQMVDAIKDNPKVADVIYKLCGDNFEALPRHLSKLERSLDRTNYALISMGGDWYRQRLTHEDREMVDMAAKYNPTPFPSTSKQSENDMYRASAIRVAKMRFEDFLFDHIDELVRLDPDFDVDSSSDKSEALWGGDFEKAIRLTKNSRAKSYLSFIRDKFTVWSEGLF